MRILMVSAVLSAAMLLSGCATLQLYQLYPAFGTLGGGRLVLYDRRDAHNLLPPSSLDRARDDPERVEGSDRYRSAAPTPAPHAQRVR